MNDESLTLPSVVARFRESEELLQQLGDQLRSLRLSAETSNEAASSLASAAEETRSTSAALANLSHQLQEATASLRDAVNTASTILEDADVSKLLSAVEAVQPAVHASLDGVEQALIARLDRLEKEMGDRWGAELHELASAVQSLADADERRAQELRAAKADAEAHRKALEQAKASLSPRALKKARLI